MRQHEPALQNNLYLRGYQQDQIFCVEYAGRLKCSSVRVKYCYYCIFLKLIPCPQNQRGFHRSQWEDPDRNRSTFPSLLRDKDDWVSVAYVSHHIKVDITRKSPRYLWYINFLRDISHLLLWAYFEIMVK
jgi:hypothetical protein